MGGSPPSPCASVVLPETQTQYIANVFTWDEDKNALLLATRGVGFHDAVEAIAAGILDIIASPTHAGQQAYIVRIKGYVCVVPFDLRPDGSRHLRTIYQSRKHHHLYGDQS